jgi:tetratricopeptide (TPR) repeat protein
MSQSTGQTDSNHNGLPASGGTASVGYKRPPANKRFAKGNSGNRKGRPKGTPNVADILARLFNKKIAVRSGYGTQLMGACEAISRNAVAKAQQGDGRMLTTVLGILEMLGATNVVTAEEREKRTGKLPRPYTMDEYVLTNAESREKERQYYRVISERDEVMAGELIAIPSPIQEGDELKLQSKSNEALAAYCQQIAVCQIQLVKNANDSVAQSDHKRAIARIGLLADQLLLAGDFAAALHCADQALAHGAGTDLTWIELIRAHANMFINQTDDARKFYLHFRTPENQPMASWESYILQNFDQLRTAGHSHPLMIEIEKKLLASGWTAQGRRTQRVELTAVNHDDQYFILINPDDIQTGALLAKQGKLDEAANVYRRILEKCQARLTREPAHAETRQALELVVLRFGLLAEQFVYHGRFPTALECAETLLAVAPEQYWLHAMKAHTLMFLGHDDQAQDLYLRYRGQKIGDVRWETSVLADFKSFQQKGRLHQLMDKIEKLFSKNDWVQPPENVPARDRVNIGVTEIKAREYDDVHSGDRLFEQGNFDEAFKVYCRSIALCQANLANGRVNLQAVDDREIAISRICGLVFMFTLDHNFQKAVEVADEAIKMLPNSAGLNLRRAHAVMFLNNPDEARALYKQYRIGKAAPERTWHSVILEDFSTMRNAGLSHPLMDEIEQELSG